MTTTNAALQNGLTNTILLGNCIETMERIPANSIDFILTDPPYLVNYRDRTGRSIQNDANADWLKPRDAGSVESSQTEPRSRHVLWLD